MSTTDKCCTIVPYFKIAPTNLDAFRALCKKLMTKVSDEPGCLYYGFSFADDEAHCREGYADAEAMLIHNRNVADLFAEVQKVATVTRLEVHGPAEELAKLREPLSGMRAQFFVLEYGFRR